ncbi:MAG: family 78 glycoside hydrolase catalytic domain [Eubacteriales bacterium]|nr:family 78 glycoside hydrolase catalytic domain [Eubacteriales bacterium]
MEFSSKFVSECLERSTYTHHVAAPLFRRSVVLEGEQARGEILLCGLGFYELFVNGRRITKGALAPYISNPDHIVYYDRYDLTPYLRRGENVIGVMLGDGFQNGKTRVWDFMDNVFNSAPKLALCLRIEDGSQTIELEAADFYCKKGPVLFNDLRSGVFYDRRLEEAGWNAPGFVQDEGWHAPVAAEKPRGEARLCEAEPIAVTREISPVSVRPGELAPYESRADVLEGLCGEETPEGPVPATGGYLFDFGENNAGIFRLRIKGEPGQRIDIQCGEELLDGKLDYSNINFYPDGYAQRDSYILGSGEEEIFEPPFTYHGFRYLYVCGITPEQATPELLTYLVMSSDLEERGDFSCSDEMANRIYEAAKRSDASNFYYFPTDCPHREKNGWTGDAAISAEHMILTRGTERSWREWLRNIRCAQRLDGQIPGIVPTGDWGYEWGNGPAWDRVLFELPYQTWKYRGETGVIRENARAMMRYLDYISTRRDENGIVAVGLGDWVPVDRDAEDYQAPLGFTDSVMVLDMCRKAREMFAAVGLPLQAAFAEQLGTEMLEAVRRRYLDGASMMIRSACQSAQAMGVYYDVFTDAEKPAAFGRLMELIRRDGGRTTCGFLGLRVLFHVLAQFGEAELAYRMMTGTDYPSYGYFISKGDTTIPEWFLPDERRRTISQNHHFLCDLVQWYMRYPGGIEVRNSKAVTIHPRFIEALSCAQARHSLPDGEVSVRWQRDGEQIRLEISCPETVDCELVLDPAYYFVKDGNCYLEKAGAGEWTIAKRK